MDDQEVEGRLKSIALAKCQACGEPVFSLLDHARDGCASLENRVHSTLLAGVINGFAGELLSWTDEQVAEDLLDHASSLEGEEMDAVVPHVATWRAKMAERSKAGDGGDEKLGEIRKRLGLGESSELLGPFSLRSRGGLAGLMSMLQSGGAVSEEARLFEQLKSATDNIGEVMNNDRLDDVDVAGEYQWVDVPGARPIMRVAVAATADEGHDDQHLYCLMQSPDNRLKWQLWSLCPNTGMSAALDIVGDEKRALHRASLLMDMATGRLSKEDFWARGTGQPWPRAGEGEHAADHEEHEATHPGTDAAH